MPSSSSNPKPNVTRKTLAQRSGVSPTVISHVLNNTASARVNPDTRAKVLQIAHELGYVTNALGRALVEKRIRHIGVAYSPDREPDDILFQTVLSGIIAEAEAHDHHVLLFPLKSRIDDNLAPSLAELVLSRRVDGLILNKEDVLTNEVEKLVDQDIPLILINGMVSLQFKSGRQVSSVALDVGTAAGISVQRLLEAGHRRIALFRTEHGVFDKDQHRGGDEKRMSGYLEVQRNQGIPFDPDLVPVGDFSRPEAIAGAVRGLLALPSPPTAVIAANDIIAMRVAHELKRHGLRLPADMSLVGASDLFLCDYFDPPLTSVRLPLETMGRLAARQLVEILVAESPPEARITVLPVTIHERQSVAPPRSGKGK